MAATEDIVETFGGMEAMSQKLIDYDIGSVGKMLKILINAGCEYCELMGQEYTPLPKGRITALLSVDETAELVNQIMGVMTEDAAQTVEVAAGKN